MHFEFREGIGKGTYNTDLITFTGSIKHTDFEKDVWHGKCEFWYNDGDVEEEEYKEGKLISRVSKNS